MSLTLRDRQLSSTYASLEAAAQSQTDFVVNDAQFIELIAAAGDRSGANAASLRTQLAGLDKAAQLALCSRGVSATEKRDLENILDRGEVALSPQARNFLAALVGREPLNTETLADLQLDVSQADGLSGKTHAGWVVEAINLSTAPSGRLHTDDVVQIASADATGRFNGAFIGQLTGTQQGDLIRLRARDTATGKTTDWLNVRANGLAAADTRNAQLALFRMGLSAIGNGEVELKNINDSRQISEPFATLELTNRRTGEKQRVTLNGEGTFAGSVKLKGLPGDDFTVAVSDGTNNTSFTQIGGRIAVPGDTDPTHSVDIEDPKLHRDELNADGTPRFEKIRFEGPLFENGVNPVDVRQGQIGDCYLPAAIAAIAQCQPDLLRNMIVQNPDKTYTVTFKERTRAGFRDVRVKVDGDLYVRAFGGPLYGSTNGPQDKQQLEMWWPILEKAYASWKGSYDVIGSGGLSSDVFTDLLGADATIMRVSPSRKEAVWSTIKAGVDGKRPLCLGTSDDDARYAGTGIYGNHAYSVFDYKVEANGQRMVMIRNPWGQSVPNELNDGICWMKLEDVVNLFDSLDRMV